MGEDHAQEAPEYPRKQHEIEPPSGFFLCGILSYTPRRSPRRKPTIQGTAVAKNGKPDFCLQNTINNQEIWKRNFTLTLYRPDGVTSSKASIMWTLEGKSRQIKTGDAERPGDPILPEAQKLPTLKILIFCFFR